MVGMVVLEIQRFIRSSYLQVCSFNSLAVIRVLFKVSQVMTHYVFRRQAAHIIHPGSFSSVTPGRGATVRFITWSLLTNHRRHDVSFWAAYKAEIWPADRIDSFTDRI